MESQWGFPMSKINEVAIIGGGSIGVSFAIIFAGGAQAVRIFEPDTERRAAVETELLAKATAMEPVSGVDAQDVLEKISLSQSLEEAVSGAGLVQECVPEKVELKRAIFQQLSDLVPSDTIIASSSSAIPASESANGLKVEQQTIVAHPGNPPHLLPVIEIVPSPSTDTEIVRAASNFYRSVGMKPVQLKKEIEGFLFNRLQGAMLREAYALVRDGIADVDDIDTVVREGLGKRWFFMGPFEVADLNTRGGIRSHAEKLGPTYERQGAERGQHDPWTPDLVQKVEQQRREILPIDQWEQRVQWRDEQLLKNLAVKNHNGGEQA